MNAYKITLSNGTAYITNINLSYDEAKKYFLGTKQVVSHCDNPKEAFAEVIQVTEVQS